MISETFNINALILVMGGWILSVCFHEFSHALVAYFGGDTSVKDKGYLTFNPLRYTHPTMSIVYPILFLLIGGIGLPGGAVYINTARLRNRLWNSATSFAGPLSNIILLAVLAIPFRYGMADVDANPVFWSSYAFLCFLQLTAIIFNLIPIPPLDGFGTISPFIGSNLRNRLNARSQMLFFALIVVMWTVRPVSEAFWKYINLVLEQIGIPFDLVISGINMIRLSIF